MIANLLLQINNKKIENLLPYETYKLYKYLYKYKIDDPLIKTVLSGIKKTECTNEIEQIIISFFFMHKVKISCISHRIYIQEYFPKFAFLIIDSQDLIYKMILEYYFIKNQPIQYNSVEESCVEEMNVDEGESHVDEASMYTSEPHIGNTMSRVNNTKTCVDNTGSNVGNTMSKINNIKPPIYDIESYEIEKVLDLFGPEKKYKIYSQQTENINQIFEEYWKLKRKFINQIILRNNEVNNFLIHYNLKHRILLENEETKLFNCICKYFTHQNLERLYDILEDKTIINLEINKRNLFIRFIWKIVAEALTNPLGLTNLRINKRIFYKALSRNTMVYKKLIFKNFRKYIEILKIVRYNKKNILLVEWLKTFIYFGKIELFNKLFTKIKNKISKKEASAFNLLAKASKSKTVNFQPFVLRCLCLKDSEFCVYSYRDIIMRLK